MYKVTGGYTPQCAYPGLKEYYRNRKDAIELIEAYWVLDWLTIEALEDDESILQAYEEKHKLEAIEAVQYHKDWCVWQEDRLQPLRRPLQRV